MTRKFPKFAIFLKKMFFSEFNNKPFSNVFNLNLEFLLVF